jgi:DNA-binding MarR family transcriptional regulator
MDEDIIDSLMKDWRAERPELDTSAMGVVGRILSLGKKLEKRAGLALADSKLHYTDLDVLATLRRSGAPYSLTPSQLMQSVLITSGAMTALLDRLTKMGLIYRKVDDKDKRVKHATLTALGLEKIDEAIEIRFQEARASVEFLKPDEKEQLARLLKKMMLHLS